MRGFRVILCMIGVLVVGGLGLRAWMFPKYEPPMPSGEYNVETALYTWEDPDRKESFAQDGSNRKVTVKFWYPKQEGTYPLVVFSHGAFGVIDSNYSTCAELASRGYVVASIAHPYHAMYVEDVEGKKTYVDSGFMKAVLANDGSYTEEGERKSYEQSLEWMELRTKDMNFVLDTILSTGNSALFSMIDPEKIGLMGHSLGGATAVEVGRNRKDIRAVIDLEGTMLGEYAGFENGFEVYDATPYPIPVLDVNGSRVRVTTEQFAKQHPGWIYVNDYLGQNALDYRRVEFEGAGHLNYTDLPLFSPPLAKMLGVGDVDAEGCIRQVNEMVCIYFDYYLKGIGTLENIPEVY